jgi:outer membrane autotransporter protein
MQSGIAARCRKLWLIAASTLASAFLGVSEPALAQIGITPVPPSGTFEVTSAGNPYPTGITLGATVGSLFLNVTLASDVKVVLAVPGIGVALNNFGNTVPVVLSANGATVSVLNPAAGEHRGLYVETQANNATITASGPIDVSGGVQGSHAIKAFVNAQFGPGNASVTYNGPGLSSTGANSTDIQAQSLNGNATIDASGNMSGHVLTNPATGANDTFVGLFANAGGDGNASVTYRSGTIDVQGRFSNGIFAGADGNGTAQVTTLPGTTIIVSGTLPGESTPSQSLTAGITAELGGAAALGSAITVNAASTINMFGKVTPNSSIFGNPVGIRAISRADAPITVNYTGPGITTEGGGGIGILALANNGGGSGINSGGVTVASSGPITTNGTEALGIVADSGTIYNVTHSRPQLGPGGNVTVTASGAITTQGAEAHGIWAASTTGTVLVNAFSNVSTTGQFSTGINAISSGLPGTPGGNVTVNVAQGVSVNGGWQAGVTGVGSSTLFALPAAGVILNSTGGTATLTNFGSIGALSDRAVAGDPQVTNNGTITGFVQFTGDNNSIINNGTFNLRHFADTNGDGVRDTVRVAVADLGAGPNNSFTNNGTLALVQVTGATTLDSTGQYLPLGQASNTMALNGPLQGHLIGVATFTNSGTIDLQANPVPGDVLMITGGRGGSTPGTGGGGTFITGGTLKLDTVLNQGGAATRSDTLVVDGTGVGLNGATSMAIRNAGGTGALTVGDGILVVQVLDPARSADGAFKLASHELRAGEFDYRLFHGGIGGSNPGDWFLRNDFVVGPPVVPPGQPPTVPPTGDNEAEPPQVVPPDTVLPPNPPPTPLPPGVFPIIGPEIATYGVVQPLARQLGLAILGTLDDRVGDTYEPAPAPAPTTTIPSGISKEGGKEVVAPPPPVAAARWVFAPSVWSRFFAQGVDTHYRAFADPSASGNLWGFQLGVDLLRGSLIAGHYERAGLYGAFGQVNSDVTGLVTNSAATAYSLGRTGSVSLNAWSAGGYWTHVGPGGWYLDGVLQGTWYRGSASTQFANLDTDGKGFIASLEGGVPFSWPQSWPQLGPGFVIEPQGQILWQKVSFQDKNDGLGVVALGDTTGPSGRIGLRTKWTIATAGGQVWQPYLRANLWRDWGADANTVFSGKDVAPLESQANVVELGGGLTVRINANVSVYANADYEFAVGATDDNERNGVRGAFGARYTW